MTCEPKVTFSQLYNYAIGASWAAPPPLEAVLEGRELFLAWDACKSPYLLGWVIELLGTPGQKRCWARAMDKYREEQGGPWAAWWGESWLATEAKRAMRAAPTPEALVPALVRARDEALAARAAEVA